MLGNLYLAAGGGDPKLLQEVSTIAQKILVLEPQNVRALILSGNAAAGLRDYETSVEIFEKALSLDPQNPAAFVSLGTTQVIRKNFAEAEQAFLKARQADPKNRSALISLANFYRATNEMAKAEEIFKEASAQYLTTGHLRAAFPTLLSDGRADAAVKLCGYSSEEREGPEAVVPAVRSVSEHQQDCGSGAVLLDLKRPFQTISISRQAGGEPHE
jgi:tetratricopeptide (TPR) repeat protein